MLVKVPEKKKPNPTLQPKMPSTPKADPVEILTQLSDDPHVNFYPWEMDVQDASTTLARTLHPLGLLSSILTDRQWEEYPSNATMDAQGQVQIAPRYTPPAYTELDPNMSSVQLYVVMMLSDEDPVVFPYSKA